MLNLFDILRDPIWQGIGVIIAIILGFIGFFYAKQQKIWLYLAAALVVLLAGVILGVYLQSLSSSTEVSSSVLLVDKLPGVVFDYSGADSSNVGNSISSLSVVNEEVRGLTYVLNYTLPDQGTASTGVVFRLREPHNISDYDYLEFLIKYDNPQTALILNIRDDRERVKKFRIGSNVLLEQNVSVTTDSDGYQLVRVGIKDNLQDVNARSIAEIEFSGETDLQRGSYVISISQIRFIKVQS
jgi:hypothetical protein